MNIGIIVGSLVYYMLDAYLYSLIIYIILSYFPKSRETRFFQFFRGLVEPLLYRLRFLSIGMISLAPIVIFILINLIQSFLTSNFEIIGR